MSQQVSLTRVVTFSSGHRYWLPHLSESENRALFGKWASPFNHGHNFVLHVTTVGSLDPSTGMVVNIKDIDDVIQNQVVQLYDQKSINDEIEEFKTLAASTENIVKDIAGRLTNIPVAKLTRLDLYETPTLCTSLDIQSNMLTLTRTYEFAASHRLHSDALSDAENVEIFGKCNHIHGHGHNYLLEVTVTGEQDPRTGFIVDLEKLDDSVNKLVVDRYDHRNLNVDVPELHGKNPTSEVVALAIFQELERKLPAKLAGIRLHETARNIFEVKADGF